MLLRTRAILVIVVGTVLGLSLSFSGGLMASRPQLPPDDNALEQARVIAEVMARGKRDYVETVDDRVLLENAIRGMVGDLDPHSEYLSAEEFRRVVDTNLTGTFLCCKEAMPRFQARGGGFVINISSLAGKNPFPSGAAYNASKFGLNGFSEAMMMDHRYDNVRVSYVMPGSVDTEFRPKASDQPVEWKIAAKDVADIVMFILRMPQRSLVSRVEVRPSRPKK